MDNNSTTINDDDILDTPEACLVKLLKFVASNSNCSHWYRFFDRPGDNPSSESRRLMNKEDVVKIDQFNELSFHRFLGLDEELYSWMLVQCGITKFLPDGTMRLRAHKFWEDFITKHEIEAEIVTANLLKTKVRYYIRIGPKSTTCTWYTSVLKQVRGNKFSPPRCPTLEVIGRRVNGKLRSMYDEYIEQQKKIEKEEKESNNNDANQAAATLPPPVINYPPPSKFPLMDKYGLDQIDMETEDGSKRMKRLLGEMIAKQQLQTGNGNNNKFEFYRPQQSQISTAVAIRTHASENAFRQFHYKNPYLEDVVGALDPDKKVGAQRLSDYLAGKHQRQFVEAALLISPAIERALDPTKMKKSKKEKKKNKKRATAENNGGGGKIAAKKPKKDAEPRTEKIMEQASGLQVQAQSVGVQAEVFGGKSLPTIDDMYK